MHLEALDTSEQLSSTGLWHQCLPLRRGLPLWGGHYDRGPRGQGDVWFLLLRPQSPMVVLGRLFCLETPVWHRKCPPGGEGGSPFPVGAKVLLDSSVHAVSRL